MEWIDVNDRLPDTNNDYRESEIVLCYDDKQYAHSTAWYNSRTKVWTMSHYKASNEPIRVTHWQHLPPPPKNHLTKQNKNERSIERCNHQNQPSRRKNV